MGCSSADLARQGLACLHRAGRRDLHRAGRRRAAPFPVCSLSASSVHIARRCNPASPKKTRRWPRRRASCVSSAAEDLFWSPAVLARSAHAAGGVLTQRSSWQLRPGGANSAKDSVNTFGSRSSEATAYRIIMPARAAPYRERGVL